MNNEKQKEGIKGVWIPGEVAFNKELTKTDMFIWWQIDSLDCTEKNCYAGNEYIAKNLNINPQTVSNSISKLKKLGYINQIKFNGRIRILARNDNYIKKYRHLVDEYNAQHISRITQDLEADYTNSYKQTIPELIIDKNSNKNSNKRKNYGEDSHSYKLSKKLLDLILQRNPKYKFPDLQKWSNSIDLLIRIDKKSPDEISKVIEWCQADTPDKYDGAWQGWANNILSTIKLRAQFEQLYLKMNGDNGRKGSIQRKRKFQAESDDQPYPVDETITE